VIFVLFDLGLDFFDVGLDVVRLGGHSLRVLFELSLNVIDLQVLNGVDYVFKILDLIVHLLDLFLEVSQHEGNLWRHLSGSNKLLNRFLDELLSRDWRFIILHWRIRLMERL